MKKNPFLLFFAFVGFSFLLFIGVGIFIFFSFFGERPSIIRSDAIGIIKISGLITESEPVLKLIEKFKEENHIKAVIVRINSPGGMVGPTQEIYQGVSDLRKSKKVVASLEALAASGGYYIACAAHRIVANPGTITGSIGVIMEFMNIEKLYQWAKMEGTVIKSGRYKDMGSPLRAMKEDEKELLSGVIGNIYQQFKNVVLTERKIASEKINEISDGRIFSGEQARQLGLVDELGNFQVAIEMAKTLSGIKGKPEIIYPPKEKKGLVHYLMGESVFGVLQKLVFQETWTTPFFYVMPNFQ